MTRFYGYLCLLTDVWPPFSFDDDPGYPVRVAIPPAQRLNRAAVFFRCILVIPAWFMPRCSAMPSTPIGFVAWLVTLVTGRLPRSLHFAYLAVVRYQARAYGYGWLLLTPAYPGGLYGDGQATATWADAAPAAPDSASPAQGYGMQESVYGGRIALRDAGVGVRRALPALARRLLGTGLLVTGLRATGLPATAPPGTERPVMAMAPPADMAGPPSSRPPGCCG